MGASEPTATTQSSMESSPPDSRIRYEVTPFTAGGLKTAPVATLNVEKCQRQLTITLMLQAAPDDAPKRIKMPIDHSLVDQQRRAEVRGVPSEDS